ncbi:MAG: hypothetical protein MJ138_01115 [Kiritimatiellae bacterium]|nr:hypothetical protein [Kiritimatiellia bacterium]
MKSRISELTVFLAAALLAASVSAAPTAAEVEARKRAQALEHLAKKNDTAVNALRRKVEDTWNWHNAKKAKDFAEVTSNVNEIVRLVTLKEGAARAMTVADAKLLLARAYARPVNLRLLEQAKKSYADAIAAAPEADKAKVRAELADYLADAGQAPKPPAAAKAKPPVSDQKALREWYANQTADRPSWSRGAFDALAPEECLDYKLKACDDAMAELSDPAARAWFRDRKASLLVGACKWSEAEAIYLEKLAEIKDPLSTSRMSAYCVLADFYARRAARYYEKPDRALSMKSISFWEEALRIDPKNTGNMRPIVTQAFLLEDWDLAKKWLDKMVAARGGKTDEFIAACYGDVAYYAGDYAAAVEWYEKHPKLVDPPQRVRIPNVHQRHTGALFALGRYEDCLKSIDKCPNFWSFKDTNAYYRRVLKAKIEAQKAASGK